MNRVTLLVMFCLTYVLSIQGQTREYVSLEECNNDTLKFISLNFIGNEAYYIGKPLSKFMEDLGMDIYYRRTYNWREPNISEIWGININYVGDPFYFYHYKRPFYSFLFEFERPYTVTSRDFGYSFYSASPNRYNSLFKDHIIKDMEIRREGDVRGKIEWKDYD